MLGALTLGVLTSVANGEDTATRLVAIKAGVSSTEKVIADLKLEFSKLKKDQAKLQESLAAIEKEERALNERSAQVARDRDRITGEVRTAEERVARQRVVIRDRLRSLYMNSAVSARGLVLGAGATADLERVAVYARSVRGFDQARFNDVAKAVEDLRRARAALDQSLDESKRLQGNIQNKRGELEQQRNKLELVMRQIDEKQEAAKRSLAALMQEANKLEELLRSITSGDKPLVESEREVEVRPTVSVEPEDAIPPAGGRSMQTVLHPGGLFAQTARVVYPVRGEVVQRFGKTKVTNFADMIFSKGFEFKTQEGAEVKAVLGGKVAFAGTMPGYDMVVIIDHGARSYSLYGRLGKAMVAKDDLVAQRDVIGTTSTPDNKGRNFYFETRKNGAPVDPGSVLSAARLN
jgi:septal ring factor EnvC (AmiA/AmiB activator)